MVEQASGGEGRGGNPTEDNRKAVRRAMENIENNTPSLTQGEYNYYTSRNSSNNMLWLPTNSK